MRIKNKEIRRRRHRKEVKITDANRALRIKYGEKTASTATAPKAKAPAKKAAAKPAAKAKSAE